ncbi:hypothetical protein T4A_9525 [Trichinella pseudospiralis]|uniref:Uncharacterized protein n=1 Tax=Trichinella pseudospiralis TaxID=6337 RepID=A0A0V1E431_TRIPS|nr:hypothetical protein T4A_9525 [Trichinella pseudospiralis]
MKVEKKRIFFAAKQSPIGGKTTGFRCDNLLVNKSRIDQTLTGESGPDWQVELASTLFNAARCLATQLQRHLCYSMTPTSTLQTVIDQKLSLERGLFCRKSRVLFALNHCSEQCPEKSTSRCRRRFVSKVYICLPASLAVEKFPPVCAF